MTPHALINALAGHTGGATLLTMPGNRVSVQSPYLGDTLCTIVIDANLKNLQGEAIKAPFVLIVGDQAAALQRIDSIACFLTALCQGVESAKAAVEVAEEFQA